MKRTFASLIRYIISQYGYRLSPSNSWPTPCTDTRKMQRLINSLHPLAASRPLIRLGPSGDGGYLIPDDLQDVEACFSPGVSTVSGFEKECAARGMKVFLADHSVDSPTETHPAFSFTKKFVGVTTSHEFMTMNDWVAFSNVSNSTDLLLQIDIEGFEYEVFLNMSDSLLRRFRIIVAEFHWLDQLWSEPFFNLASRAFERILQSHSCVHIHPNNCCGKVTRNALEIPRVMEFTFLRHDRFTDTAYQLVFPSPLDFDNINGDTLPLPKSWYSSSN